MSDIEVFNDTFDEIEFKTIPKQQIAKIKSRLPEYKRGKAVIGHGTSQSSYSLQTMNMISDSPLSRMKQCLAQIDKKYTALKEAYFGLEKKKAVIRKLQFNTDERSKLTVKEYESQVESIGVSMETALREIGMFQNMYDDIKKNNNIPDNWSEKDFEKQEISHMVKSCFRIGIQDLSMTGRVSKAFVEYSEQLGMHPQVCEVRIREYMNFIALKIQNKEIVTINDMYSFLDKMADEFKDSYKDALSRMGLDELGSEEFMSGGHTKPQ